MHFDAKTATEHTPAHPKSGFVGEFLRTCPSHVTDTLQGYLVPLELWVAQVSRKAALNSTPRHSRLLKPAGAGLVATFALLALTFSLPLSLSPSVSSPLPSPRLLSVSRSLSLVLCLSFSVSLSLDLLFSFSRSRVPAFSVSLLLPCSLSFSRVVRAARRKNTCRVNT